MPRVFPLDVLMGVFAGRAGWLILEGGAKKKAVLWPDWQ